MTRRAPVLPASKVLVTVGTGASMSAIGSTETQRARISGSPLFIAHAAFDAGLVDFDLERSTVSEPRFRFTDAAAELAGTEATVASIESRFGPRLRDALGIRRLPRDILAEHISYDVAAPLPHDLAEGGLRRLAGLDFASVRASTLRDMLTLFDDDPRLGPGLQSQLFMYAGLGALAALPRPLAEIVPDAHRFRIAAAAAFAGFEGIRNMQVGMQRGAATEDKVAYRLSTSLATHGPGMLNTLLSPAFRLLLVKKDPSRLEQLLRSPEHTLRNVPQCPLVNVGACASAQIALADALSGLLLSDFPGYGAPQLLLWTSADSALATTGASILEGFGPGAMITQDKLDALNADRPDAERRAVGDSLAPFDVDACGTVVGDAGSGLLITTLQFAVDQQLDVTSIIAGWGQSGETGGKGHMAGVGFGGENALIAALELARAGHGFGLSDFEHLVAHATGTRTNSVTDLKLVHDARTAAAHREGLTGALPALTVGAPKAAGDGHTMGETGLRSALECVRYLLGETSVGVPTLRTLDPTLGDVAKSFTLRSEPLEGNTDGGTLSTVQGFGGYVGAVVQKGANPDTLGRYTFAKGTDLDAYLERWPEVRRERVAREARHRRTRGMALALAEEHAWPGLKR